MALSEKELEAKLWKDATFIFIKNRGKELPKELDYWGIRSTIYVNKLKDCAQEILNKHKRSSFAKNFIPSIIEQFDQKGYISNRQTECIRNYIEEVVDVKVIDSTIHNIQALIFTKIQNNYSIQISKYLEEAAQQYEEYRAKCRQNAAWEYKYGFHR